MSDDTHASWQLEPATAGTRLFLVALCVVPLLVGVMLARQTWLGGALAIVGAIVLAIVLDLLMRRHRVRVDASGLEVASSMYRRKLAWSELSLDAARVIDLDEHPGHKPAFKTNGMATFGFKSGNFRSRSMGKLFVATVGGKRVLWLPTTLGYTLVLQPRRPQALLERLRELAPAPPRR